MYKETMTDFSNQVQCNISLYPAIYVTDGYKGEWIYANAPSVKALKASIAYALGFKPGFTGHYFVERYSDFGDIEQSQLSSVEAIHHFASFFWKYGELGTVLLRHLDSPKGDKIPEALQLLEKHYCGIFESEIHFLQSLSQETIAWLNETSDYQGDSLLGTPYFSLPVGNEVHIFNCLAHKTTYLLNTLNPKIYVSCLSSHHQGIKHGQWIDATQGADGIVNAINALLANSSIPDASEWVVLKQKNFICFNPDDLTDIQHIAEVADFIKAHGALGAVFLRSCIRDIAPAQKIMEDYYVSISPKIKAVQKIAEFIEKHGKLGALIAGYFGGGLFGEYRMQDNIDHYCGAYKDTADYACHVTEERGIIPEGDLAYMNYEEMAKDMFREDYVALHFEGQCHVFDHRHIREDDED